MSIPFGGFKIFLPVFDASLVDYWSEVVIYHSLQMVSLFLGLNNGSEAQSRDQADLSKDSCETASSSEEGNRVDGDEDAESREIFDVSSLLNPHINCETVGSHADLGIVFVDMAEGWMTGIRVSCQ